MSSGPRLRTADQSRNADVGWSYDVVVTMPSGEIRSLALGPSIPSQAFFGLAQNGSPVISRNMSGLKSLFILNEQVKGVSLTAASSDSPVVLNGIPVELPMRLAPSNTVEVQGLHVILTPLGEPLNGQATPEPTATRKRQPPPVPNWTPPPSTGKGQYEGGSRKSLVAGAVVLLAVVGGGAYMRLRGGKGALDSKPTNPAAPVILHAKIYPPDREPFKAKSTLTLIVTGKAPNGKTVTVSGYPQHGNVSLFLADHKQKGSDWTLTFHGNFPDKEAASLNGDLKFSAGGVPGNAFPVHYSWRRKATPVVNKRKPPVDDSPPPVRKPRTRSRPRSGPTIMKKPDQIVKKPGQIVKKPPSTTGNGIDPTHPRS